MFDWLAGYLDQITSFFQFVWDFLSSGIYDFVKDGLVLLTKAAIYSWIQVQLLALEVAYQTAQEVMQDIGLAEAVRQRFGALPAEVVDALNFFGIPQALNIIFSALSTRLALKFVPFIGR